MNTLTGQMKSFCRAAVFCCLILLPAIAASADAVAAVPRADPPRADPMGGVSITTNVPLSGNDAIPVATKPGCQFIITLPSNRATGYHWRLVERPDGNVMKFVCSAYARPSTAKPDQFGSEWWTFRATGPGVVAILMQYVRVASAGIRPIRTQVFVVRVD